MKSAKNILTRLGYVNVESTQCRRVKKFPQKALQISHAHEIIFNPKSILIQGSLRKAMYRRLFRPIYLC